MARRAPGVGQPMPQADRGVDRLDVETPRAKEYAPVLPPPLVAVRPPIAHKHGEVFREVVTVRRVLACLLTPCLHPAVGGGQLTVHLCCLHAELSRAAGRSSKNIRTSSR